MKGGVWLRLRCSQTCLLRTLATYLLYSGYPGASGLPHTHYQAEKHAAGTARHLLALTIMALLLRGWERRMNIPDQQVGSAHPETAHATLQASWRDMPAQHLDSGAHPQSPPAHMETLTLSLENWRILV